MHIVRRIGYILGLALLATAGLAMTTGSLVTLFTGKSSPFADHSLVFLIVGVAVSFAAIWRLRIFWIRATSEADETIDLHDKLVEITEVLFDRNITRTSLPNNNDKEEVNLARVPDVAIVGTEYTVTHTTTEQLMPTERCPYNTEMRVIVRFYFNEHTFDIERTLEVMYVAQPGTITTMPLIIEPAIDSSIKKQLSQLEKSFIHAGKEEVDELIGILRRTAESCGIVLDG